MDDSLDKEFKNPAGKQPAVPEPPEKDRKVILLFSIILLVFVLMTAAFIS